MVMKDWAEMEVELAKKKNKNDYLQGCYDSALKAYKAITEDGHSGCSWNVTAGILKVLLEGKPLTMITDDDFFDEKGNPCGKLDSPKYLEERGLKSVIQCPRQCSLFRYETLDGKVYYSDVSRSVTVDVEQHDNTYHSGSEKIIDELFPITMPYMPPSKPYKVYEQEFLVDKKNGGFDTKGILYVVTPDGERIDIRRYYTTYNDDWVEINSDEYFKLKSRRLDTLPQKTANYFVHVINSDVLDEKLSKDEVKNLYDLLLPLCGIFDYPRLWKYNTYNIKRWICGDNISLSGELVQELESVPEIMELKKNISDILNNFKNK